MIGGRCRFFCRLVIVLIVGSRSVFGAVLGGNCYTDIDPRYYETDVHSFIRATTPAEVQRIRAELVAYIWKASALPIELPEVESNVANPFAALSNVPNLSRIDRLTVTMDDYVARMHLYVPEAAQQRLMIIHQGHNHQLGSSVASIRFFLAQQYAVLIVHMPLYGPNTGPYVPAGDFHDRMFAQETAGLSPFRYFVEPVVCAVNYAEQILNIRRVYMMGLSGGGWTTVFSAALDPRIKLSISVAGSLPLYLRRRDDPCSLRGDRGDREQYDPELYAIADYLDLYILASSGPGRGHLQVLNQFDSCCFAGVRFLTYRDIVKSLVAPRRGRYDVFLDSSHESHTISPYALERAILPFLRRRHL